jgi:hypothetical protein
MIVPLLLMLLLPKLKNVIKRASQVIQLSSAAKQIAFGIAMSTIGWLLCRVHLSLFDKIFLYRGKVR